MLLLKTISQMKVPFIDLFKRGRATSVPSLDPAPPSIPRKPEGERLSKTVMPNSTRVLSTGGSFETGSGGLATAVAPPSVPHTISFSPKKRTSDARNEDLPPAVALALEPKVERAVSLELADVIRQLPAGLTKPAESFESNSRILLKAAEIEKGMAHGKPSVSLGSIYQQMPEIFLQEVAPADEMQQIALPFEKVMEAFGRMQTRRDQRREPDGPQFETPFLQATLEDSERFGIPSELPQIAEMPPVRLEPATAEAIAAAEPETTIRETITAPFVTPEVEPPAALRIPLVDESETTPAPGNGVGKSAPERIPFRLPPKETGAPASERVPASCGPPVSTPLRPPPEPASIPFSLTPPEATDKTEAPSLLPDGESQTDGRKITLKLKPILSSMPVFQLTGDPKEVPDDACIELPLLLIQSQLATGRIAVAPELFERSLPSDCRRFFSASDLEVPVVLPLHLILAYLPSDLLQIRPDQEAREEDEQFETPFSTAADEDAKRFAEGSAPVAPPPIDAAEVESEVPMTEPRFVVPEAEPLPAAPSLDAKSMISQVNQLPGVRACALSFSDGLSLAGQLPTEVAMEGLCAVAPSLLQRIATHVLDTKAGSLQSMTLHCTDSSITFFLHGNISLATLHANGELTAEVRNQLSQALEELSRTYSQPEVSHVHN